MGDWNSVYAAIKPYTVVTSDRCHVLWLLAQISQHLVGDFAEVGVYRGGTSMLLKLSAPEKTVHAFDTFAGIPNATATDGHVNGDFPVNRDEVVQRLNALGIVVHEGYFPATVEHLDKRFSLAHFDGDTYQSCQDFLDYFYPRMVTGGVMVFDDYEWHRCPGVKQAITSFLADKPEKLFVSTSQAIVVKV